MSEKVIHLGFAEPMGDFEEEVDEGVRFLSKIGGKPVRPSLSPFFSFRSDRVIVRYNHKNQNHR